MTLHLGDVPASSTLYIPFATYNSDGASVTLTGLAVTDIEIYANGGTTQRSSDAGYTLLDTDGIDFDSITGIHGFSIDLSDNTDAGFYAVGSFYWVVVSAVTIDSQTVNFIAATFRIKPAEGVTGVPDVNVTHWRDSVPAVVNAGAGNRIQASLDATGMETGALNEIADSVWDEARSSHATAGTFGQAFEAGASGTGVRVTSMENSAITSGTLHSSATDEIVDGVWDELQSGHVGAGTFGEIATEIAAILVDTAEIANLNDISAADVNAQVLDVLNTDTFAEPTGVPPATDTLANKIGRLHMALRNQITITATKKTFYDDGGNAEWEQDLSDDGTTFTQTEANAI